MTRSKQLKKQPSAADLKEALKESGVFQTEAAKILDYGYFHLTKVLSGERKSLRVLRRVSELVSWVQAGKPLGEFRG